MPQRKPLADQHRESWVAQHPSTSPALRRLFLKTLGLGAAGLAVGGGAAWLANELDWANATATELRAQLLAAAETNQALLAQLTEAQTTLTTTKGNLSVAVDQNTQLVTQLANTQLERDTVQTQLATTQTQLDTTAAQLAQTQSLLALYEELETTDLDTLTRTGLQSLDSQFTTLFESVPLLREGVIFARTLLSDFEASLPSLAEGVNWLLGQLTGLGLGLSQIEATAQQVVTATVTGLTAVFSGFVGFILNYLPFQIGDRVTSTLTTTQTVLAGLPTLITETETKIGGTLAPRLSASEAGWQQTLVRPLYEKTLSPTEKMLASLHDTRTLYRSQVQTPVEAALTTRAAVRERIAHLRQEIQS